MSERLVFDFPEVPEYRTNLLALSLYSLADALRNNGRGAEAEPLYSRVLEIMDATQGDTSGIVLARLIRGGAAGHLGGFRLGRREYAGAVRFLERAVADGRAASNLAPGNPGPLQLIAEHGTALSRALLAMGERPASAVAAAEAARAASQLARIAAQPGPLIEIARILAYCATTVRDPAMQRDYTTGAVEALRSAISKGFQAVEELARDRDLAPLMSHPDIRSLVMDLAMPADPFAR
jgi:hypothetical protein